MVGIFFGSFDPPHIGHVNVVTAALNSGKVDKVIVVPAYKSVWKNTETKWEYRLAMAKETFDNIPGVVVDGIEYRISNGEPLPTYKTIEALKEIYGEFTIVTSAETYKEIPRWQHGEEIQEWLDKQTEPYRYIILDDDSDMLDCQLPYFIQTDWLKWGLSDEDVEQAIHILNDTAA